MELLWLVVTLTGALCQDIPIIQVPGHARATAGMTSLNLTCNYENTAMRFLQVTASKVTWSKMTANGKMVIYTVDLESMLDFGHKGHFKNDWVDRGILVSQPFDLRRDIQLPALLLNHQDGGLYECDLEDTDGIHYRNTTSAVVYFAPVDMVISSDDSDFKVVEGQNFTLSCHADCNPGCNYTWHYGSEYALYSEDGVYHDERCNRSDAGNYTCVAVNDVGNNSVVADVEVFYGAGHHIWFQPYLQYQNLTEGSEFTVTCFAKCNPACIITWAKEDNQVPSQDGVVVFKKINRTDSGSYVCHAMNRVTNESHQLDLNVQYGPGSSVVISPPGQKLVMLEGGAVNLTCQASCHPVCHFAWSKDGTSVGQTGVFSLSYVLRSHAGIYTCTASNSISSSTSQLTLDVQYAAEVKTLTINNGVNNTVAESSKTTFYCHVESNPIPRITWMNVKTQTIVKQEDSSLDSTYVISGTSCLDAGYFQCAADNGIGSESKQQIQLYVSCSPRDDKRVIVEPTVLARRGSTASLSLSVVAYPTPSFLWFRLFSYGLEPVAGPKYKVSIRELTSTLAVSDVTLEDYGPYTVNVTNGIGTFHQTFNLTRADSPEKPAQFYCTYHTTTSVQLRWISENSNGATQIFHVEYAPPGGNLQNLTSELADLGQGETIKANVTDLEPSTMYMFLLTAKNKFGHSGSVLTTCYTQTPINPGTGSSSSLHFAEGVGTGVGVCLVAIAMIVGTTYLVKRRNARLRSEYGYVRTPDQVSSSCLQSI